MPVVLATEPPLKSTFPVTYSFTGPVIFIVAPPDNVRLVKKYVDPVSVSVLLPPLTVSAFVIGFQVVPPVVVHEPSSFVRLAAWNVASGVGDRSTVWSSGAFVPLTVEPPESDVE